MKRLEAGQETGDYREEAQELPDEAAFMRKVFERSDFRISVDCQQLEAYIEASVSDIELRREMSNRLVFIMMEMDPSLRTQAFVLFFQQYYVHFSGNADLQRMIDFVLNYQAMEGLELLLSRFR